MNSTQVLNDHLGIEIRNATSKPKSKKSLPINTNPSGDISSDQSTKSGDSHTKKNKKSSMKDQNKTFNKDAVPFIPRLSISSSSSSNSPVPPDTITIGPSYDEPLDSGSLVLISINNIPPNVDQMDLEELVDSFIEQSLAEEIVNQADGEIQWNVISFHPLNPYDPESNLGFASVILVNNLALLEDLIAQMDGMEWEGNELEAIIIPQPPVIPYYGYGMGMNFFPMSPIPAPISSPSANLGYSFYPVRPPMAGLSQGYTGYPFGYGGYPLPSNPGFPTPHYTGKSSVALSPVTTPQSRRSLSSSVSSGQVSNPSHSKPSTGVPPFLMNFVSKGKYDNQVGELIDITDEDGSTYKVNSCRLFVGNIPFSLTWSGLRTFLVNKSQELEPDNDIEILRVEIPMHTSIPSNGRYNTSRHPLVAKKEGDLTNIDESETSDTDSSQVPQTQPSNQAYPRTMSRGFAIVTTGNKESSDKLIKYFEGMEFEGRNLTVRYDRFPDFNNYQLQQLFPNHNKDKALTTLAFERNSIQQKFYYGNNQPNLHDHYQPRAHSIGHGFYNHNYGNHTPIRSNSTSSHSSNQNQGQNQPHFHTHSHHQSPRFPIVQPNFVPQIHPSVRYTSNMNVPRSVKKKSEIEPQENLNEDEKARQLVNSFKLLGISS